MKSLVIAATLSCAAAAGARDTGPGYTWVTYGNTRFGFSISYPADLFTPNAPPANNDGRSFRALRGGAQLIVYGGFSFEDWTKIGQYKVYLQDSDRYQSITYERVKRNWLVLSGYRGGDIYYEKHILSCNNRVMNAFEITYPKAEANIYSPLISDFVKSFRAGNGYDNPKEDCR